MSRPPEGLTARLLRFGEELRAEGVSVGTSEVLDAVAALQHVSWESSDEFRAALAATLAKSQQDHRVFELVFERFFFRAAERAARELDVNESDELAGQDPARLDPDELRRAIADAIARGDESAMRDFARLAVAAFGSAAGGSGVLGVDVQRLRRMLALRHDAQPGYDDGDPRRDGLPKERLAEFERMLRRELERRRIEAGGELPPTRPLAELDRVLPSAPVQDLAAVHRVVAQLKRRLKTQGHELRGQRRREHVDMRRTARASLEYGGVPVVIKRRPVRPRRPEIFVLCDVSTSVTSASVFFLSVLHALHDSFRKMRSYVFIERVDEVTEIFERERDFRRVSERIATDAAVSDVSGYTDYGRVWTEFADLVRDDLHHRCTLIVLGDARTNGRDPRVDEFARVAAMAGRTFWLNPEPRLYWNYGDSVVDAYTPHCQIFECGTTAQLEAVVRALVRPLRT